MKRIFKKLSALLSVCVLGACGGGLVSGPPSGGTTSVTMGEGSPALGTNASGNRAVFFNGSNTALGAFRNSEAGANFKEEYSGASNSYYYGFGELNNVYGFAAMDNTDPSGLAKQGVAIGRTGPVMLPGAGTATYTGGYLGTLHARDIDFIYRDEIVGQALVSADFNTGLVDVTISNRRQPSNVGDAGANITFDDVVARGLVISPDATFGGTPQGGTMLINGSRQSSSNQNLLGMFGGAQGQEVASSISIDHQIGSVGAREQGFLLAN